MEHAGIGDHEIIAHLDNELGESGDALISAKLCLDEARERLRLELADIVSYPEESVDRDIEELDTGADEFAELLRLVFAGEDDTRTVLWDIVILLGIDFVERQEMLLELGAREVYTVPNNHRMRRRIMEIVRETVGDKNLHKILTSEMILAAAAVYQRESAREDICAFWEEVSPSRE